MASLSAQYRTRRRGLARRYARASGVSATGGAARLRRTKRRRPDDPAGDPLLHAAQLRRRPDRRLSAADVHPHPRGGRGAEARAAGVRRAGLHAEGVRLLPAAARRRRVRGMGRKPTGRPVRSRSATRQSRTRQRPIVASTTVGVSGFEDRGRIHAHPRRFYACSRASNHIIDGWPCRRVDEQTPQELLQRLAGPRRARRELVADAIRDIPHCDGNHACVIAAIQSECRPVRAGRWGQRVGERGRKSSGRNRSYEASCASFRTTDLCTTRPHQYLRRGLYRLPESTAISLKERGLSRRCHLAPTVPDVSW